MIADWLSGLRELWLEELRWRDTMSYEEYAEETVAGLGYAEIRSWVLDFVLKDAVKSVKLLEVIFLETLKVAR